MDSDPTLFKPELQARRAALDSAQRHLSAAESEHLGWPALQAEVRQVVPGALRRWRQMLRQLPAAIWSQLALSVQTGLIRGQGQGRHFQPRVLWFRFYNALLRWQVSWRGDPRDRR